MLCTKNPSLEKISNSAPSLTTAKSGSFSKIFFPIALYLPSNSNSSTRLGKRSICDALLASQPGKLTFAINQSTLNGGLIVSEEEVKKTIITLAENLKIITEPGGAVAAAAVLNKKINTKNKNVVVMISGGNIDSEMFLSLK